LCLQESRSGSLRWLEGIESESRAVIVHRLEFSDIAFGAETHGVLRLDGESDVRAAGEKILGKRARVVKRAAARIREGADDPMWPAIVERDARTVIQASDPEHARDVLRATLLRALG